MDNTNLFNLKDNTQVYILEGINEALKEEIERLEKQVEDLRDKNYELNTLLTKADEILNFSAKVEESLEDNLLPY